MRVFLLILAICACCPAQPTVAPAEGHVGSPRGQDVDGYNIVNTIETGYRFHTVGGNPGKYRSDVNFGNGVRLLSSSLSVHSKEGHGRYFDELLLNTQGLGNDPYQLSSFRLQKNRLYRYDLLWRESEYFNPGLSIAMGQHFLDTTRRLQDHSVVLFPQASFKVFAGFSRNSHTGPALSTVQLFDGRDDEYPLFENVQRQQSEYRAGAEIALLGTKLTFLRSWEYFKDDTTDSTSRPLAGNNPQDNATLSSFYRSQPGHGRAPGWRVQLLSERNRLVTFSGRFVYAGGRRDFIFDETAIGTSRFGGQRNRQLLIFGNARRPVSAANFTLNVFPGSRVTVVNHTAFHHTRMDGDGSYRELNNATLSLSFLNFQFLGIRTLANLTDIDFRASRIFTFYGGYHFSNRRIRSVEQSVFAGILERLEARQENTLHSGLAGVRIRPLKPFLITLDAELGRADRPVYPISERNYHALSARIQYRTRTVQLGAAGRTNYNTNSVSLSAHSSRARSYSADAAWSPLSWFSFDTTYNKTHLDTLSGIAYFWAGNPESGRSEYVSNIHAATLGVRFSAGRRLEIYGGYSRVQDTAGKYGGSASVQTGEPSRRPLFQQVFPLTFESPLARLSVRLHEKIRWNAGYQYYRYDEKQRYGQDYRAHAGFSSVTWTF